MNMHHPMKPISSGARPQPGAPSPSRLVVSGCAAPRNKLQAISHKLDLLCPPLAACVLTLATVALAFEKNGTKLRILTAKAIGKIRLRLSSSFRLGFLVCALLLCPVFSLAQDPPPPVDAAGDIQTLANQDQEAGESESSQPADSNIEVVTTAVYVLFLYLLLALLVERLVEVLMACYNYIEHRSKRLSNCWNRKARALCERLSQLRRTQGGGNRALKAMYKIFWNMVAEPRHEGGRHIVSANLIRIQYKRVGGRILSFLLALALVFWLADVKSFNLLETVADFYKQALPNAEIFTFITSNPLFCGLLSAVGISLGVEPLHEIISRIEARAGNPRGGLD